MPIPADQILTPEQLTTIVGGQSLTSITSVPGAWRPNAGLGRPPTPAGSPISNLDKSFAAGERAAQTGGGGGGGGGKLNPFEKPQLLY